MGLWAWLVAALSGPRTRQEMAARAVTLSVPGIRSDRRWGRLCRWCREFEGWCVCDE